MKSFIPAKPTAYDGTTYRSKLEAKWAVFFDALGAEVEYEPFQIEASNGVRWTPDFFIFSGVFNETYVVEIKPIVPNEAYIKFLADIIRFPDPDKKESTILLLIGEPDLHQPQGIAFEPSKAWEVIINKGIDFKRCEKCGQFSLAYIMPDDIGGGLVMLEHSCSAHSKPNQYAKQIVKNYRFDL